MSNFISIYTTAGYLDLNPDTVIHLSLVFPNPSNDAITSSIVQWFTIPATEHNDKVLGYSRMIPVTKKIRIFEDAILAAGTTKKKGIMLVKSGNKDAYKVAFSFSPFFSKLKDRLLPSLEFDTVSLGSDTSTILAAAKSASLGSYPTQDFAFPRVRFRNFYGEENKSWGEASQRINEYSNGQYKSNSVDVHGLHNRYNLVPFFYLKSALSAIFNNAGGELSGAFMADDQFSDLVIFNNFGLDKTTSILSKVKAETNQERIYVARSVVLFDIKEDPESVFNIATSEYTITSVGLHKMQFVSDIKCATYDSHPILLVFQIKVNGMIEELISFANAPLTYSYYDWNVEYIATPADIGKAITMETYAIVKDDDVEPEGGFTIKNAIITYNPITLGNLNIHSGDVNLANHLPNITVNELVNSVVKTFTLALFTDGNQVELVNWNDLLNSSEVLDLTSNFIENSQELDLHTVDYALEMKNNPDLATQSVEGFILAGTKTSEELPIPDEPNILYYVRNLNKYLLSYYDSDLSIYRWRDYFDNFKNINSDLAGAKKINIGVTPMKMEFVAGDFNHDTLPTTELAGTSLALGTGINDFPFSLLHYFGIIQDGGYAFRPVANTEMYDLHDNQRAEFALRLNGNNGLHEKFGKQYYEYISSREPVQLQLDVGWAVFEKINALFLTGSKIRKIRIINRNYIPKKIDFEISMNGEIKTKAWLL